MSTTDLTAQTLVSVPPEEGSDQTTRAVDAAITSRVATRFFLTTPVSAETMRRILDVARFAPSGGNIQPWRVYVLAGQKKRDVTAALEHQHKNAFDDHAAEYKYFPAELPEPYKSRRAAFGAAYFGKLGIGQADQTARFRQSAKNLAFFGAPIGMIFTIDRRLETGSWVDFGMFLQNIMIAAKGRGLDTCPQETLAKYHRVLRDYLPITPEEIVVCGMSLGYCDLKAARKRGTMVKLSVSDFAHFDGLE